MNSTEDKNNINELKETMSDIARSYTSSISDMYKKMSENFNYNISRTMSDITSSISDMYKKMGENLNPLKTLNKTLMELSETISSIDHTSIDYVFKMYENNWIPFIGIDREIMKQINDTKNEQEISNIMIDLFDDGDNLDKLLNIWKDNKCIKEKRYELLKESVYNYKQGLYASCSSILMTQIGGIIDDIESYVSQCPEFEEEIKKIKENQKKYIKDKKILNKDKKRIERVLSIQGDLIVYEFNDFLDKYVYCNTKKSKDNIPNRNSICHGYKYDFTKEYALKSILIIDSLIRFSIFVDREELNEE